MHTLRDSLSALWQALLALWRRATGGSVWRQRFFAGGAALGLLLIVMGVVFASMAPPATQKQRVVAQTQATATATETATATATVTPTPTATAKPCRRRRHYRHRRLRHRRRLPRRRRPW